MLSNGHVGARQHEVVNMRFGNGVGSGAMSPGSAAWAAARCLLVFVLTVSPDRQLRGREPGLIALGSSLGRWRLHVSVDLGLGLLHH